MPIVRVDGPDGTIHRLEVPEGATPQEIESFAAQAIPVKQSPKMEVTRAQTAAASALRGIPFGQDMAANLGALVYGRRDIPFSNQVDAAKKMFQNAYVSGAEKYPYTSTGSTIAAGVPVSMALPLATGGSVLSRAVQNAGTGAVLGAAYGLGEGTSLQERIPSGIEQGFYGGVTGGALSPVIDAGGAAIRAVPGLARRAASLFTSNKQPVPNINVTVQPTGTTGQEIAGQLRAMRPQATAPMSTELIPLTKGQATQSAPTQSLEYGAQAGNYGQEAQKMALEARQLQAESAKNVLQDVAGAPLAETTANESAAALKAALIQSYKAAKAKTTAAYKEVGDLSQDAPLQIAGDYVRNNVIAGIKDWARKGSSGRPWDLMRSDMGEAKRLYDQAAQFGEMKKLNSINFFRMEDWRGRVSQAIEAAPPGSPSKAFLGGMLERYDRTMGQLPREAIKSGDEAILTAMEKARGARKEQGVLFERSKLVKDILQNEDLTQEQLGNTLTSLGPKIGIYVRDILRTAAKEPEKQAALKADLQKSILGSVYTKSLSSEIMEGGTVSGGVEKMISFDKLSTQLDKLFQNKTLMNNLFDKNQIESLAQARNAAALIKSVKPGSKNYSNTAYTILNALKGVSPSVSAINIGGIGLGTALKAAGDAGAENELKKSLEPVLRGIAKENTSELINLGVKYGGRILAGGAVNPNVREGIKPSITDAQGNTYNLPDRTEAK